jgi:hypothetical protein
MVADEPFSAPFEPVAGNALVVVVALVGLAELAGAAEGAKAGAIPVAERASMLESAGEPEEWAATAPVG